MLGGIAILMASWEGLCGRPNIDILSCQQGVVMHFLQTKDRYTGFMASRGPKYKSTGRQCMISASASYHQQILRTYAHERTHAQYKDSVLSLDRPSSRLKLCKTCGWNAFSAYMIVSDSNLMSPPCETAIQRLNNSS